MYVVVPNKSLNLIKILVILRNETKQDWTTIKFVPQFVVLKSL